MSNGRINSSLKEISKEIGIPEKENNSFGTRGISVSPSSLRRSSSSSLSDSSEINIQGKPLGLRSIDKKEHDHDVTLKGQTSEVQQETNAHLNKHVLQLFIKTLLSKEKGGDISPDLLKAVLAINGPIDQVVKDVMEHLPSFQLLGIFLEINELCPKLDEEKLKNLYILRDIACEGFIQKTKFDKKDKDTQETKKKKNVRRLSLQNMETEKEKKVVPKRISRSVSASVIYSGLNLDSPRDLKTEVNTKKSKLKTEHLLLSHVTHKLVSTFKIKRLKRASRHFQPFQYLRSLYSLAKTYNPENEKQVEELLRKHLIKIKPHELKEIYIAKIESKKYVNLKRALKVIAPEEKGFDVSKLLGFMETVESVFLELLKKYNPSFKPKEVKSRNVKKLRDVYPDNAKALKKFYLWKKEYDREFAHNIWKLDKIRLNK